VFTGRQILLVEQTEIHDAINAVRLVVETAKRVGEVAIRAARERPPEMALFAELGALIGKLPAYPLGDVVFSARVRWAEAAGFLGEVRHDRPGLEDRKRVAATHRLVVDNRRHPAVRGNLQKVGRELITSADVDRLDGVGKSELFEQDDNLFAISGRPEIKVEHSASSYSTVVGRDSRRHMLCQTLCAAGLRT